ncbi:hypothetical protein IPV54_000719 [Escherichia coli]|uniref:hypothetical protein n=1 Tax=Escherichia coli TaxID=562 RepID=UPI0010D2A371|nr:hypothetical protein [Escherichia coli]EFF2409720.1 hypothetical protein [Escherichia coli]EFG1143605.1 hypothetical protein [Escherichia coli]EFH8292736.1 hypothetical protein [Escherichia coli]EFI6885791.1 hypothetical protein [Escherichia coli]EFI7368607.1 hypothetical protein [Escherichia coli]
MTQPNFRRVQKRNPYQLVVDQHIHAAHCIKKFAGEKGLVNVFDKSISQWVQRKPDAAIFCAKRAWDQRAEKGYMTSIETAFFEVIDSIDTTIINRNHDAITRYFHLWRLRGSARDDEKKDLLLNGVTGGGLTIDEQEIVESKHAIFIAEGGELPHHFAKGIEIQMMIDKAIHFMKPIRWGLWTAARGEFLAADYYPGDSDGLTPFIPVSPQHVFFANAPDTKINVHKVRELNRISVASSKNYYFCRSLENCPL